MHTYRDNNNLRRERERLGLSRTELEQLSGVSRHMIRQMEEGQRYGGPGTRLALAQALGAPFLAIFPPPEPVSEREAA
jgi:transcriptional regulator with XRE-family HTH domain